MSEPCIKSDKIERLEKDFQEMKQEHKSDIKNINDRLNRHSEKVDKISDNNLVLETILKRLEEDGKEQKIQNAEVNKTMISIQGAMTEITFSIKELNNKLTETDKKVENTNERITVEEEKGKFDIGLFIKTKIVPFLIGGGTIYFIAEVVKEIGK
jgi:predicted  nucleic acid-binding Zn-ribbon protein